MTRAQHTKTFKLATGMSRDVFERTVAAILEVLDAKYATSETCYAYAVKLMLDAGLDNASIKKGVKLALRSFGKTQTKAVRIHCSCHLVNTILATQLSFHQN